MIRRVRALWRSARGIPGIRALLAAGDRLWWARTIRRAGLVDLDLVAAQGLRRDARSAVRRYVRGGFRTGMTLNPLLAERLVASQLSDVGRVPALYAYLVNDPRRVETSVSWDSRSVARDELAITHPGGPLGFAWSRGRTADRFDLDGITTSWEALNEAVCTAARRSRGAETSPTLRAMDDVVVCRISVDEDAAPVLRVVGELAEDGISVVLALGGSADQWVDAALVSLRFPRVQAVPDRDDLIDDISTHAAGVVAVRGHYAEVDAPALRALMDAARVGRRAVPLWLDNSDGTIVSAGIAFRAGEAFDLLRGHPPEDAGGLPRRTVIDAAHGDTFALPAYPGELPDDRPLLCADVIVRAPAGPLPRVTAQSDSDLTDWLSATGFALDSTRTGPVRLVRPAKYTTLDDGTRVRRLRWAIKIAAPAGPRGEWWGDTHFARGIAAALRRHGQEVVIDAYAARARPTATLDDVVLALRGPERIDAQAGARSVIWVISHPDQITEDEIAAFDVVCAASESWADAATKRWGRLVHPLLQCTDASLFRPQGGLHDQGLVFVGTARGIPRPSIIEPLKAGVPVSVYGPDWSGWIPGSAIKGSGVPNVELPRLYERATAVLNDHWPAMRKQGFVSNRLFDVVAAGGRAISDEVTGIEALFGGAVLTYRTVPELLELVSGDVDRRFASDGEVRRLSDRVRAEHSFDARAQRLLELVGVR